MKRVLVLLFISLAPLLLPAQGIQYPTYSRTLKNGLKVIVCEKPDNNFAQLSVWYRVGSKDEKPGIRGMAHMFEHMMFRGTKKYPGNALFEHIDSVGGNNNAFTTFDQTVYHEYIPVSSLEMAMDMEADRMTNLVVTQEVLNTERQVVGEELRNGVNNWYGKLSNDRYPLLYPDGHPYTVDVIGYLNEITAFTTQQCMDFYNQFYSPNNAFVVVVGNVKSDEIFALAEKYFGPITKQLTLKKQEHVPDLTTNKLRQNELPIDYPVQLYDFAFARPASGDPDHAAVELLTEMLFTGSNSVLNRRLVKKDRSAYAIYSSTESESLYPNMGIIDIIMQAQPGNIKVKKIVREELNKAANGSISQQDIDDYLATRAKQLELQSYSTQGLNFRLGTAEYYYNDHRLAEDPTWPFGKVTANDLKRVASVYFSEDRFQFLNVKPQ